MEAFVLTTALLCLELDIFYRTAQFHARPTSATVSMSVKVLETVSVFSLLEVEMRKHVLVLTTSIAILAYGAFAANAQSPATGRAPIPPSPS